MTTPSRRRWMVAVVGDGDVPPGSTKYVLAEAVGAGLCEHGFRVLTGGLGGVMEAASRGARRAAGSSPGMVVALLPGTDARDANPYADVVIPTGIGHLRNGIVALADAIVAIGGGAGTLAELALGWIHGRLLVALRVDGWSGRLADQRLDARVRHAAMADDRVYGADTPAQAVRIVRDRIAAYAPRPSHAPSSS
ncbi:MAG: LOG family protein [Myxococcota bacterium]|nr:LOG family protein [Myxococcota bacterium]MDW8363896.1 hypothetical protein [Myxococcales bacterium]